jgi:hypothetical protein
VDSPSSIFFASMRFGGVFDDSGTALALGGAMSSMLNKYD